ncbi:MAG TPA: sigma-70 family RNA polymerase sigma factor [Nevskiaceae bacterium]|nr:sigma-70 family RNA polymerase sigma factor [Nevskiaceae bacterium]
MKLDEVELRALLLDVAARDPGAFRTLYERTSPVLRAMLIAKLRHRELAEEALQDCYVKVWRHADRFEPRKGTAAAWLITLTRNRAFDLMRHQRTRRGIDVDIGDEGADASYRLVDEAPDMESRVELEQAMRQVQRSMTRLSGGERQTISLAFFGGLSLSEISHDLGVPLGTAKSWMRRGLTKLRESCEATGTAETPRPVASSVRVATCALGA